MNNRKGDIFWIEAEDFSGSDFASRGEDGSKPVCVMSAAHASGGLFVVAFQKADNYLEYTFREDRDGLWEYHIWLRYATVCPSSRIAVTLNGKTVSEPMLPDSGNFFNKFRWETLGVIHVPKGNHVLRLTLQTGVFHPDVLVLAPDDSLIASGECERRITQNLAEFPAASKGDQTTCDRLWLQHDRNGVPLGGLGTGKIELCQDGGFANISVNNNQDAPIATTLGGFLVAREVVKGASPVVRLLEKGRSLPVEVESINYLGRYPFVEIEYADKALRSRIKLEAFSPLIPYNVADSSVPGALFEFKASNPTAFR